MHLSLSKIENISSQQVESLAVMPVSIWFSGRNISIDIKSVSENQRSAALLQKVTVLHVIALVRFSER